MGWNTFRKTYVISLHEKIDRQRRLEKELQRVGITEYEHFTAMNGHKKDVQDMIKRLGLVKPESLRFFSPGHLGCLFSHYSVWQQIHLEHVNKGLPDAWYLILEDDTRFHPCVDDAFMTAFWSHVPTDAKMVRFHTNNGFKDKTELFSIPVNSVLLKQTKIVFSLMSYAIHSSFLKSLLQTVWTYHVDLFHSDGIYIAKRIDDTEHVQKLYSPEGFFSQGICITNNEEDSDTVRKETDGGSSEVQPVQLLFDDTEKQKEGDVNVHMYDEFLPTGTCHVHFSINLRSYIHM